MAWGRAVGVASIVWVIASLFPIGQIAGIGSFGVFLLVLYAVVIFLAFGGPVIAILAICAHFAWRWTSVPILRVAIYFALATAIFGGIIVLFHFLAPHTSKIDFFKWPSQYGMPTALTAVAFLLAVSRR